MARKEFVNKHNNVVPNDGGAMHTTQVCDTVADRRLTGLNVGDVIVVISPPNIEVATSATTVARASQQMFSTGVVTVVSNTTTETTLIGAGAGSLALPSDFLSAGKSLRVEGYGYVTAGGGGSRIFTMRIKKGTTVLATASYEIPAGTNTAEWKLDAVVIGLSATTMKVRGWLAIKTSLGASTIAAVAPMEDNGITTVPTAAAAVDLTVQFLAGVTSSDAVACHLLAVSIN